MTLTIEYVNEYPKQSMNIFFSYSLKELQSILKTYGYSENNINFPISSKRGSIMFCHIDYEKVFFSVKHIAIKLAELYSTHDICLNLCNLGNKYKLLLVHIISKYLYRFDKYISKHSKSKPQILYLKDKDSNKEFVNEIIKQINILNFNRDFQNEPANIINPASFCSYSQKVLKSTRVKTIVYNDNKLKQMGLDLISNMGRASKNKPKLLVIKYITNPKNTHICLLGKGVTFDSGGLNIKTGPHMSFEMKSDKTGGCTVVSLIKYASENNLNCNITGLIPLIENSVSGESLHPGDIVKSYKDKSVEILNVDAEGRIILADALELSGDFEPDYLFDMATLTGAADLYHCDTSAVFFTMNKKLKTLIENIGETIGDRVIAMPSWPEYTDYTKSNVANVKNFDFGNCNKSGTYMATMFLLNFVPPKLKNRWVHFDISNSYTGHFSNGNITILLINLLKYFSSKTKY